jgi:hypothetical protein
LHVNTRTVKNRPSLSFEHPEQILLCAHTLVEAEDAGRLERLGNWSLGRCFAHLAAFIDFAYDGYPPGLKPPAVLRLIGPLLKRRFLTRPLPAGVRIPRTPTGTVGDDEVSTDEGLARLTAAVARLAAAPPTAPNPIFGALSHSEWIALHLRHAELHLSFYRST